jgi:hypothetical protein
MGLGTLFVAGCSAAPSASGLRSGSTIAPATSASASAALPTGKAVPTTSTSPVSLAPPEGCTLATDDDVTSINTGLTGKAVRIDEAFVADVEGRRWINANVYDRDGSRLSSADVWVIVGGNVYSLSGSARDLSSFPDGRDLPGHPSAGDPVAYTLQQDCVVPYLQAKNRAAP